MSEEQPDNRGVHAEAPAGAEAEVDMGREEEQEEEQKTIQMLRKEIQDLKDRLLVSKDHERRWKEAKDSLEKEVRWGLRVFG